MPITVEQIRLDSEKIAKRKLDTRQFRALFGTDINIVCIIYNLMHDETNWETNKKITVTHVLWGLHFLKCYPTEDIAATFLGTSRKTFRHWAWKVVRAMSTASSNVVSKQINRVFLFYIAKKPLQVFIHWQINFENRFKNDIGCECLVTVDGTDFAIDEPEPFDPKWNSHKFKRAALKYEVTVSIQDSDIVLINGPFPGSVNDLVIFQNGLKRLLGLLERVQADSGYIDPKCSVPTEFRDINEKRQKGRVLARHENVN